MYMCIYTPIGEVNTCTCTCTLLLYTEVIITCTCTCILYQDTCKYLLNPTVYFIAFSHI